MPHQRLKGPGSTCQIRLGTHARLFDLETGELLRQFLGHSDILNAAAFSPDGTFLITGSRDGTVRLWQTDSAEELWSVQHTGYVTGLAISPDGTLLLTSDFGGMGRLWDIPNRELLREFKAEDSSVWPGRSPLAFSPDGSLIASIAEGRVIKFWDASTHQESGMIDTGVVPVNAYAFSPDGTRMFVSLGDAVTMTARLYDLQTGEPFWTLDNLANTITSVVYAPDGTWIATAGNDLTARIWDAETGAELHTLSEPHASMAISPDSRLLLTSNRNLWDAQSGELAQVLQHDNPLVNAIALSPDGAWMLTGNAGDSARLWETATGRLIHTFPGHPGGVRDVAFSLDATAIITAGADGTVKWWDIHTWQELDSMKVTLPPGSHHLAISPDQTRLLASNTQHNQIFDLQTGEQIHMFMTLPGAFPLIPIAFSPDGERVAVTTTGHTAQVVATETGEQLHSFTMENNQMIEFLAFSPDGNLLLTSGRNQAIVWDLSNQEKRWASSSLLASFGSLGAAVFSPDGENVLLFRRDGYLLLVNILSGELSGILAAPALSWFSGHFAEFSNDGSSLFAGAGPVLLMWETDALNAVVPLRTTRIHRDRANVILTVEGPAAGAFRVFAQSKPVLSPETSWEEEPAARETRVWQRSEVSLPFRPGERYFRVLVLPP